MKIFLTWSTKIQKFNRWRLVQITNPDNLSVGFSCFTRIWSPFVNILHQKNFQTHCFEVIWRTESAILKVCCKLSTEGITFVSNFGLKDMKIKVRTWKIQYHGFVGNVYADLGLPCFSYWGNIGSSRAHFRSKNMWFFLKIDSFGCVINRPDRPILMKKC